jgi:hypothetical protein
LRCADTLARFCRRGPRRVATHCSTGNRRS